MMFYRAKIGLKFFSDKLVDPASKGDKPSKTDNINPVRARLVALREAQQEGKSQRPAKPEKVLKDDGDSKVEKGSMTMFQHRNATTNRFKSMMCKFY
jgi:hypothetical protein